jgi:hypothetical protein
MRYLIVGNVAMLATRSVELISDTKISIKAVGISPTALDSTITISQGPGKVRRYYLVNGKIEIPLSDLFGNGDYSVTFTWREKDPNTGVETYREAFGNSFNLGEVAGQVCIIPTYNHSTGDVDMLWSGMVQLMETLIPFIEQYKYGNDAV